MTAVERLAQFAVSAPYDKLPGTAREQLRIRVLDALGCAIGALDGEPIQILRKYISEFGTGGKCSMIAGGKASPEHATLYNGAAIRYLDFNDSYLAKGETCHPSDNLAPILAAGDYIGASGRDLLAALAVAYQVQCRLSDVAPVRAAGFDHTVQGAYAVAAGVARVLGVDRCTAANAIAISGTALNALRATRTGRLSHWKGLAYPHMAACSIALVLLARLGITGPLEVMEGEKGLMDAIAGRFEIDWSREDLDRVTRTILKKYNAEIHSQTAIEGVLALKQAHQFRPEDVEQITVETFDVAYHIIGGGDEGDKRSGIATKEQADHSLPFILAAAVLDGTVMPGQYRPERIQRPDVQEMLRRVTIRANPTYSERFPSEMPCRIEVRLRDGRTLGTEMRDYPGFFTRPMSWEMALKKFESLAQPYTAPPERRAIADAVFDLENTSVSNLMQLLEAIRAPHGRSEADRV
ncbi:MAG TPA: MmgE/PrpD family protein [Candidatus Acidoferrales bacterium]|nr:MmgE/PrpD family protein [Candidatus Acidoferrales bacterium]